MAINEFINRLMDFLYPRNPNNDNMFFTLPPIQAQGLEGAESRAPTRCEVKLSEGLPQIDGISYYGLPRIPWVYSTVIGVLVTFFTSLAGGSNPCFAASIGLLLLRPYNNDYNFHNAGCPPSWNGRRRVRWNDSVGPNACGIFSGYTHIRVGNTGNGIFRLTILMITS